MKKDNIKKQKSGGRAKGTPNKITKEIKAFYKEMLEKNLDQIESDLIELSPKERLEILLKFSEFVVPKMQRNMIETTQIEGINIIIE